MMHLKFVAKLCFVKLRIPSVKYDLFGSSCYGILSCVHIMGFQIVIYALSLIL